MRLPTIASLVVLSCLAAAPAPSTQPATKPAPKQHVTLLNGSVRMYLPADWVVTSDPQENPTSLRCTMSDGKSIFSVLLNPQSHSLTPHEGNMVRQQVIEGLTKKFAEDHTEVLMKPHSEEDKRFLVKIHDRIKVEHQTLDQLHIFQMAGIQLCSITVVAYADSVQDAKVIHTAAEEVVMSIGVGPADKKPVTPKK